MAPCPVGTQSTVASDYCRARVTDVSQGKLNIDGTMWNPHSGRCWFSKISLPIPLQGFVVCCLCWWLTDVHLLVVDSFHGIAGSCLPSNVAPSGAWSPNGSIAVPHQLPREQIAERLGSNTGDGQAGRLLSRWAPFTCHVHPRASAILGPLIVQNPS